MYYDKKKNIDFLCKTLKTFGQNLPRENKVRAQKSQICYFQLVEGHNSGPIKGIITILNHLGNGNKLRAWKPRPDEQKDGQW